jgi:hypothetical protein
MLSTFSNKITVLRQALLPVSPAVYKLSLWKELIRLLYVEGQQTKEVLAQTHMSVFFIRSVAIASVTRT